MANYEKLKKLSGLSEDELAIIELNTKILGKIIEARTEQGLTQKKLEELTGLKQPAIARLESGNTDPRMTTIIKVLNSIGYTLEIVPLSEKAG